MDKIYLVGIFALLGFIIGWLLYPKVEHQSSRETARAKGEPR